MCTAPRPPSGHRRSPRGQRGVAAVAALVLSLLAGLTGCSSASGGSDLTVGVLQMAPAKLLDDTVAQFETTLEQQLAPRKVVFDVKNANGDQNLITSIARDFARSDYAAFAAIGTPAVIALAQQVTREPVIAIAIGDPVGAKVAKSLDHPGTNVTGSTDFVDPRDLVARILQATPRPTSLGTVYDPSNQNMSVWIGELRTALAGTGSRLVEATISGPGDVSSAARSLAGRTDSVLLGPDATVISAVDAIGAVTSQQRLPLYVVGGDISVPGVLASIGPDYPTVGAQAAATAAKALSGTAPGDIPFTRPQDVRMQINGATMRSLGIAFPDSVLAKSTVS